MSLLDDYRRRARQQAARSLFERSKSVNEIVRKYDDVLTRFAVDTLQGRMDARDMVRAHSRLLDDSARKVYLEGMREGGIEEPEKELDEADESAIGGWVDSQSEHIDGFADWLDEAGNTEDSRRTLIHRVDYWVQALASLGALGRASALGNPVSIWKMDPAIEKHCPTCKKLHSKKHRLNWFVERNYLPQMPGAAMRCRGFYCGCKIVHAKTGKQILP